MECYQDKRSCAKDFSRASSYNVQDAAKALPLMASLKQNTEMLEPFLGNRTLAAGNNGIAKPLLGERISGVKRSIELNEISTAPFEELESVAKLNLASCASEGQSVSSSAGSQQIKNNFLTEGEKSGTLSRISGSIRDPVNHNSKEGRIHTATNERQVGGLLGQGETGDTEDQLEKLRNENNDLKT